MEQKEQLNLKEAAELLGVKYPTLARWCKKREDLPHVKVGKAYRFNRTALLAWANGQDEPQESEVESTVDPSCLEMLKKEAQEAQAHLATVLRKLDMLLDA